MKTLYFDCFSGASGDMVVGALLDIGADFEALRQGLRSLDVEGFEVSAERVNKKGLMAVQFHVNVDPDIKQPHRHLHHITAIVENSTLPDEVKAASLHTFRRIAECEAEVHGTTVEKVHFHEVGAVDSIVDVVGAHLALSMAGVERVAASALHLGSGTVKCDHGVMPVPAPATALLVQGAPVYGGDVDGELVTPTGAALITDMADEFGPLPPMRQLAVAYGSGTKDLPDRANVLRVILGETGERQATEPITVIETNVDDMSAELLSALIEELMASGARDAFITPITGKKGRPAHVVTVLCDEADAPQVAAVVFAGSTTLGVRMRHEERVCLERETRTVSTAWGDVRVKAGFCRAERCVAAPEYEDCRRLARHAGVPVRRVYESALAAALRSEFKPEKQ